MGFYSQGGEDEIIAAAFDLYGIRNECCLEIGAADGMRLSNTLHFRQLGWRAVLIEADPVEYTRLLKYKSDHVMCVKLLVTASAQLEAIMDAADFPLNPDFISIDVDGEDYYLWADMERYRPRIVCIEYGTGTPADVLPARGESRPSGHQAGVDAIKALGERLNYDVVETTPCNVVFHDALE
jgi:hypothetical protein